MEWVFALVEVGSGCELILLLIISILCFLFFIGVRNEVCFFVHIVLLIQIFNQLSSISTQLNFFKDHGAYIGAELPDVYQYHTGGCCSRIQKIQLFLIAQTRMNNGKSSITESTKGPEPCEFGKLENFQYKVIIDGNNKEKIKQELEDRGVTPANRKYSSLFMSYFPRYYLHLSSRNREMHLNRSFVP